MSLLEESYRKIDPDGVLNMAYIETEMKEARSEFSSKETKGKNPMEP